MPNYIQGTTSLFTSYGLSKMDDILIGNSALQFTRIVVSDREIDLNEENTIDDINITYSFEVTDVRNNLGNRTVSVIAEIPESVQNMDIRTIGLVCTDSNTNTDYLFAFAQVFIKKPASYGRNKYILILNLDFNLGIVNFNYENLLLGATEVQYASVQNFMDESAIINTDIIALEHANLTNTLDIGFNKPQVYYNIEQNNKELINAFYESIDFANTGKIVNSFGNTTNITDAFYNIVNSSYNNYKLTNLANYSSNIFKNDLTTYNNGNYITTNFAKNAFDFTNTSYISVTNDLFKSYQDTVNVINKTLLIQFTLAGTVYGNNYNTDGVIIQKMSTDNSEFEGSIFSLQKQNNQLTVDVNYANGYCSATTELTRFELSNLSIGLHTLTLSCDTSDVNNPNIIMYIDGKGIELEQSYAGEYLWDYTGNYTLLNYSEGIIPYTNFGNFIRKIVCFDRILSAQEIQALSILPKQY